MKIKNKNNGVEAEVPDTLAGVLIAGGGWEKVEADEAAAPVKKAAPRKRAPKKVVEEPATSDEG